MFQRNMLEIRTVRDAPAKVERRMPRKPGRPAPCPTPGCPELTPCPTHKRIPWAGSTRRSTLPPNWETIRRRVIARDGHACLACGAPGPLEVDHIGDPNDHSDANLQTLCSPCHRRKTLEQATAARRRSPP